MTRAFSIPHAVRTLIVPALLTAILTLTLISAGVAQSAPPQPNPSQLNPQQLNPSPSNPAESNSPQSNPARFNSPQFDPSPPTAADGSRSRSATPTSQPRVATTFPATTQAEPVPNPYASADPDTRLDAEYTDSFEAIEASLERCPPAIVASPERRDALTMLDLIFHDPYAPQRKPVQTYHLKRFERVADALEHAPPPTDGAVVYMVYNMGFIVRTKTVTMGFDLIRATHMGEFAVPDDLMKRIIDRCDVLFISHVHLDHADPWVAQTFADEGKPAVGPPDLWADQPINARLTKLERKSSHMQTLPLADGKRTLSVTVNPGYQGSKRSDDSVSCNVYVVRTPDGFLCGHTGDNNTYVPVETDWADPSIGTGPQRLDVLLFNDWSVIQQSPRILRAYNPRLVIAGHFDELGHASVYARAPYWRGLIHGEKSTYPWVVMSWGESYHYRGDEKK